MDHRQLIDAGLAPAFWEGNMKKVVANGLLLLCAAIFLSACGGGATPPAPREPGEVQDIQPGQKSIIDAPAPAQTGKTIEERNI